MTMTDPYALTCNESVLVRYQAGDLVPDQMARVTKHLGHCARCRDRVDRLDAFAHDLRERVRWEAESIDFVALEKAVLTTLIQQPSSPGGHSRSITALKLFLPATLIAGLLVGLAYVLYLLSPAG